MTLGCFGEFQRTAKRIFIDIDIACSSMSSVGESLLSLPSTSHSPLVFLQFPSSFFFYPHNCKHIVRQLKLKRYFRKICVIEGGTDLMILEVRNYPAPGGKEERRRKIFGEGKCNHQRTNQKQWLRKDRATWLMKAEINKKIQDFTIERIVHAKSQYCIERIVHTTHELEVHII